MTRTINRQFIDGQFARSEGQDRYAVTSAITGETLAEATMGTEADAVRAVAAAKRARPTWSATSLAERRGYLQKLADAFEARSDEMVSALVEEFGTTMPTARYIVAQSRDRFRFAQDRLTEETFVEQIGDATVNYVPLGVAVLITPWNGASWFMAMKASVALAAGCTVVFKPSERGVWQVQPVIDALADAGLPDGVINVGGRAAGVAHVAGGRGALGVALQSSKDLVGLAVRGADREADEVEGLGADGLDRGAVLVVVAGREQVVRVDRELGFTFERAPVGLAQRLGARLVDEDRLAQHRQVLDTVGVLVVRPDRALGPGGGDPGHQERGDVEPLPGGEVVAHDDGDLGRKVGDAHRRAFSPGSPAPS